VTNSVLQPVSTAPPRLEPWIFEARFDGDAEHGRLVVPQRLPCYLGRDPQLALCVAHPGVSLLHAELWEDDGGLHIRDMGSRNGTYVNGERTEHCRVAAGDLVHFGPAIFELRRENSSPQASPTQVADPSLGVAQFPRLLLPGGIRPHFQPLVKSAGGELFAFEALARSTIVGLESPLDMFRAAKMVRRSIDLSRAARLAALVATPEKAALHLFLNTHPQELTDCQGLVRSLNELRSTRPSQPLTLEIHEDALLDMATMTTLRDELAALDIAIALDDFGRGQARLLELLELRPKYVKFDGTFCRKLQQLSGDNLHFVRRMLTMLREQGVLAVAEAIEDAEAARICRDLGFDLLQGFFVGRPQPASALAAA
jgi:EAL domain-containing protein (putative c-di-GMP-specific phosphodiesterase class I)